MTIKITSTNWQPAPSPVSRPLVAIGDIHGCADLLVALRAHLRRELQSGTRRVYLGDLIDPHPRREHAHDCSDVVDQVALDMAAGADVLAGNHDAFFLIALEAARNDWPVPFESGCWSQQGGAATAAAFGIEHAYDMSQQSLAQAIFERMSDRQRAVFAAMRVHVEHDAYVLVHAGFHPTIPLEKQIATADILRYPNAWDEREHPLWMRFKPSSDVAPEGRILIHGHTSVRGVFAGRKRINIDTGAKYGGPLTALEIVGDRMRLHQAWPEGMDAARWHRGGVR
jgi:serine/threonine protein phosphatase 1